MALVDHTIPTFNIERGNYSIPQTTTQIEIRNGKSKDNVFTYAEPLVIEELKLALTHKKSFKAKLRIEVLIFRTRLDEQGEEHRTLVKEMLDIDKPPKAITNANVDKIGSSELKELNAKCDDVGTVGENGSGWIIKKFSIYL